MARTVGIWVNQPKKTLALSLENAIENAPEGFIEDQETGELVDYSEEFAALVLESAEIVEDTETVAETTDAIDNGEVVAEIGDAIEQRGEATPEEAALVQAGVANTLDATDAPEEVVEEVTEQVATESANGPVISMEGFKETLKRMWEGLKAFVADLLARIATNWKRFFNTTAGIVKDAAKLAEKLKDRKDGEDAQIKWSSSFALLAVEGKKFDAQEAVKAFGKLENIAKSAGTGMAQAISEASDGVIAINGSTSDKLGKVVAGILAGMIAKFGAKDALADNVFGKAYKGGSVKFAFGDFALAYGYNASLDQEGDEAALINSFRVTSTKAHKDFDAKPEKAEFAALTKAQIEDLVKEVKSVANALDKFYNGGAKQIHKSIDALRGILDKTVAAVKDDISAEQKHNYKVAQRLFNVPVQLLRGEVELSIYVIRVLKAFITLGNVSAAKLVADK